MLKERKIGKNKFYLVARSWSNSRAWGHECELYWGDSVVQSSRIRYYNRTWECWQYQSVMLQCLEDFVQKKIEWNLNYWKERNDVKRMTKDKRAEFDKWFKEQGAYPIVKGLEKWKKELMGRN